MNKPTDIEGRVLEAIGASTISEQDKKMISLLSNELSALHHEIRMSDIRVEKKLTQRLIIDKNKAEALQVGLVAIPTSKGVNTLNISDTISFGDKGKYSPIQAFSLADGQLIAQFDHRKLLIHEDGKRATETKIHLIESIKGKVFLGVHLSNSSSFSLYISTPKATMNFPNSRWSSCSFWLEGKRIPAHFGRPVRETPDQYPGEQAIKCYQSEKEVLKTYASRFVNLDLTGVNVSTKLPESVKSIPELESITDTVTHWIEVRLPHGMDEIQGELIFVFNPVLVVNRHLKQWSSNELQSNDDFTERLKISEHIGEIFLYLERVNGLRGEAYREVTYRPFQQSPPGSYQLCKGGLGKDNIAALIQELEDTLQAFHRAWCELGLAIKKTDNDIKAIQNHLYNLYRISSNEYSNQTPPAHYLQIRPRAKHEQVTVWYWVSDKAKLTPEIGMEGIVGESDMRAFWI